MNVKFDMENLKINPLSTEEPDVSLTIQRRLYTQDLLDSEYMDRTVVPSIKDNIKSACSCNFTCAVNAILGFFPLIQTIRDYSWRNDLVSDLISGLAVSFLHMPQGLALGLLAMLPPVYGLYSTLYPVLIYLIFGTCRHLSMGTNAILSLITAGIVERELKIHMAQQTMRNSVGSSAYTVIESEMSNAIISDPKSNIEAISTLSEEELVAFKVGVVTAVAFLSGVFLLGMGLLRVGFVTSYMSPSFVRAFTSATAFHIVTSQVPRMLNVEVPAHLGLGKLVKTYIDIFRIIGDSNPADIIVSALSFVFLLGVTIFVNERYDHKMRVPVPLELIIVIVSTLISHFAHLEDKYGLAVVGDIPLGLPPPTLPDTEVMGRIAVDSFIIAILIFTLTITLAKLMAEMHDYTIDCNQELIAFGMCNFLSSFFQCIPSCTAPPRTMILCNTGAKSTLNGVVTVVFILLVILVAGRLFMSLPIAVLAVMIATAVKNLLLQVQTLPALWRLSKADFLVWIITFATSVLLDLDIGIAIGLGASIFIVIVKSQLASGSVGSLSSTENLILFGNTSERLKENEEFKLFRFPSPLFFANAERFSNELFSKTINPLLVGHMPDREKPCVSGYSLSEYSASSNTIRYVILECSAMTYIDVAGANTMKRVASQLQKVGVTMLLAKCPQSTLDFLDRAGYFETMDRKTVFHDIYDAVGNCSTG